MISANNKLITIFEATINSYFFFSFKLHNMSLLDAYMHLVEQNHPNERHPGVKGVEHNVTASKGISKHAITVERKETAVSMETN